MSNIVSFTTEHRQDGSPTVSRKMPQLTELFQGIHGQGKSRGFFKVMELSGSGDFVINQGILELSIKSGKSQGILK